MAGELKPWKFCQVLVRVHDPRWRLVIGRFGGTGSVTSNNGGGLGKGRVPQKSSKNLGLGSIVICLEDWLTVIVEWLWRCTFRNPKRNGGNRMQAPHGDLGNFDFRQPYPPTTLWHGWNWKPERNPEKHSRSKYKTRGRGGSFIRLYTTSIHHISIVFGTATELRRVVVVVRIPSILQAVILYHRPAAKSTNLILVQEVTRFKILQLVTKNRTPWGILWLTGPIGCDLTSSVRPSDAKSSRSPAKSAEPENSSEAVEGGGEHRFPGWCPRFRW